jgi:hypothetical protein
MDLEGSTTRQSRQPALSLSSKSHFNLSCLRSIFRCKRDGALQVFYQTLSATRKDFRLLRNQLPFSFNLSPSITAEIDHFPIEKAPENVANPCKWDDSSETSDTSLNSLSFGVQDNIRALLWELRNDFVASMSRIPISRSIAYVSIKAAYRNAINRYLPCAVSTLPPNLLSLGLAQQAMEATWLWNTSIDSHPA